MFIGNKKQKVICRESYTIFIKKRTIAENINKVCKFENPSQNKMMVTNMWLMAELTCSVLNFNMCHIKCK